jgi:hypothetical protein
MRLLFGDPGDGEGLDFIQRHGAIAAWAFVAGRDFAGGVREMPGRVGEDGFVWAAQFAERVVHAD